MTHNFAAAGSALVTFAASIVLAVTHASAQTPLEVDRVGIQQHRDYLRLQPFEQVDTGSSNLILTLPQLTLPGNARSNLIFQLTYNSNTDVSPNPYPDWPWRFGIAGVPMQVLREGYYPTGGFMNTLAGTEPYTPVLRMADGAIYRTVYANPNPNAGQQATMYEVRTSQFWKYHQDLHTLEIPDGRVLTYQPYESGPFPGSSNLRLTHIQDAFGNTVDLGWSTGELDVVQTLRDGTSRTVHFTMNETTGLPLTMTFNDGVHDRLWTYMYEGGQAADTTGRLTTIDPPELQSDWTFEYHDFEGYRRLWHLTTPHGGIIEYDYIIQHFTLDGQPEYTRAFLHTRDIFDRDSNNISAGQWVIDCTMYAGGSFCEHTTIRTPSALLTYTYGDLAIPNPTTVIEGPVGLKHVKVQDPTGANTFEDEDLTYTELAVVGSTYRTVEVSQRSLQRNTAVYTTTVTYGDFRLPSHIFESGDVSRTTERTYETATSTPYLAGLLASESIAVGSEAVHRNFSHDSQGFTTSATEPGVANNLQMSFTRDDGGNIASVTRRGLTTSYTYSHGSVETISTPLTSIVRSINLDGTVASESKGGRTTTFGYDLLSRVTSVQPPSGNPTITEYDGAGTWIRTTRGASVVKATLDGFGRPTLIEKAPAPK